MKIISFFFYLYTELAFDSDMTEYEELIPDSEPESATPSPPSALSHLLSVHQMNCLEPDDGNASVMIDFEEPYFDEFEPVSDAEQEGPAVVDLSDSDIDVVSLFSMI